MRRLACSLLAFPLVLTIVSCASSPKVEVGTVEISQNPEQDIAQIEAGLQQARTDGADWLSPGHFAEAEKGLKAAKELKGGNAAPVELSRKIAEARAHLKKAEENTRLGKEKLADAIEARRLAHEALAEAKQANVRGYDELAGGYEDADKTFFKLPKAIEGNELPWAESKKTEVIATYLALEIASVKKATLDEALKITAEAIRFGAEEFAAQALAASHQMNAAADKFIAENPRKTPEVKDMGRKAQFFANRALHLTRTAQEFKAKKPEEMALWVEQTLFQINQALEIADLRDRRFESQVSDMGLSIRELVKNYRMNMRSLASQAEVGKPLMESHQKFAKVKEQFTEAEAEVVKDSGTVNIEEKVIIRLKGLKFDGNDISAESQPILEKVLKSVQLYDGAKVSIEGHVAGGTKGAALKRAKAVRNALVSGKAAPAARIKVKGAGTTEEKIEVVITASTVSKT